MVSYVVNPTTSTNPLHIHLPTYLPTYLPVFLKAIFLVAKMVICPLGRCLKKVIIINPRNILANSGYKPEI
jgi:hypothetical protein